MKDLLPILSTLKRHKTAAGLIVLQIALTCAIVCNALFLISLRLERINELTGMADAELVSLGFNGGTRGGDVDAKSREDVAALKAIPGVRSLTLTNQLPFGGSDWNSGVRLQPEATAKGVVATQYYAGDDWLRTFGAQLVAGRDFAPEEYIDMSEAEKSAEPRIPAAIINRQLAQRLFQGDGSGAVGQVIYIDGTHPIRLVGVLERFASPNPGAGWDGSIYAVVKSVRPNSSGGRFLLRVAPGQHEAVLKAAGAALEKNDPKRIVNDKDRFTDLRARYYRQDVNMAWLMGGVCVALLMVTAFGIVGLASFWVQQRTRMIGTRRALGATRGQILRYFQTENFLLSSLGIALGMLAAYGISLTLTLHYQIPRLPVSYLPLGALCLWLLGQLAVLAPAWRAAALPPVAALRA